MILTYDQRTVGTKGRPKKITTEVKDFAEARSVIASVLKRKKKSDPQQVLSNIQLRSKALSK